MEYRPACLGPQRRGERGEQDRGSLSSHDGGQPRLDNRSMEVRPAQLLSRTQPFENRLVLLIGQPMHAEVQPSCQFGIVLNMQHSL
ncbi:MAG: hypothetical protein K0S58_2937 [Nitrospira sp.]|nr:hypothetical protein [Nitrospira sp.]